VDQLLESGTYLRQFGSKDRLVDINNTLRDVHTRWKQLLRDAETHARRLSVACRDDKRVRFSLPTPPANSLSRDLSVTEKPRAIRYDTICYFNVRSKADMSQLNLPHGTDN